MAVYGFNDDKTKADLSGLNGYELLGTNSGTFSPGYESSPTRIGNLSDIAANYSKVVLVIGLKTSSNQRMNIAGQIEYPTDLLKPRQSQNEQIGETSMITAGGFDREQNYRTDAILEIETDGSIYIKRWASGNTGSFNYTYSKAFLFGIKRI